MKKDKLIVPFIREITWLGNHPHGWGNGYAIIPPEHFDAFEIKEEDYQQFPDFEITFDHIINHKAMIHDPNLIQYEGCRMIGFDTCHAYMNQENWPKERVQSEAEKLVEYVKNYALKKMIND